MKFLLGAAVGFMAGGLLIYYHVIPLDWFNDAVHTVIDFVKGLGK